MYVDDKSVQVTETYTSDGIPETGRKAGTADDREAMRRLGKQQQFKVHMSVFFCLCFFADDGNSGTLGFCLYSVLP